MFIDILNKKMLVKEGQKGGVLKSNIYGGFFLFKKERGSLHEEEIMFSFIHGLDVLSININLREGITKRDYCQVHHRWDIYKSSIPEDSYNTRDSYYNKVLKGLSQIEKNSKGGKSFYIKKSLLKTENIILNEIKIIISNVIQIEEVSYESLVEFMSKSYYPILVKHDGYTTKPPL